MDFAEKGSGEDETNISDYSQYVAAANERLDSAARRFVDMRASGTDKEFDKYALHHRFLMQFPGASFSGELMVEHLGQFSALCDALLKDLTAQNVSFFFNHVVQDSLIVLMRWRDSLTATHRDDAILKIEGAADALDAQFRDSRIQSGDELATFLEFKNALLFFYYVSANILEARTRQDIRNNHLQVAWSVGRIYGGPCRRH